SLLGHPGPLAPAFESRLRVLAVRAQELAEGPLATAEVVPAERADEGLRHGQEARLLTRGEVASLQQEDSELAQTAGVPVDRSGAGLLPQLHQHVGEGFRGEPGQVIRRPVVHGDHRYPEAWIAA